jgi:hypothetical protein
VIIFVVFESIGKLGWFANEKRLRLIIIQNAPPISKIEIAVYILISLGDAK